MHMCVYTHTHVHTHTHTHTYSAFLMAQIVKHLLAMQDSQDRSLYWEIPWRREWQPTPVFLPVKSHGQRSLEGYGPWGGKESDTTGVTYHTCTYI